MEFRLLGPLEVAEDGRPVSLGGARPRALLALLLLHRNEVVTVDRIVDELWAARPPKTAGQVVRVYVSNLRKALGAEVLITRGNGYLIEVAPQEVDVDRFEALRAEGRRLLAAGETAEAADVLGEALSLWRGQPLQEFAYEAFAQPEIARLEELRLATLEDRFDAQLAAGGDSALVADLEQLVEANPLRERLRAQLMLALYRSGRQADALEAYQRGRRLLVDELGLEPGETLRRLETRILQQDPELDSTSVPQGSAVAPTGRPARSRRLAILGIAALLLGLAATVGILIAATGGHSRQRPIASLRVALVTGVPPSPTYASPTIEGLRAAAQNLGFRTRILYGGGAPRGFLRKIAAAARTSDLVVVDATPDLEAVSRLTRRFPGTRFLVPDSVSDPRASFAGQRNVTGVNFDDRENGYLGGYLAGLMTHGDQPVSAVGGQRTDAVRGLIRGFTAGARAARPRIRVLVHYTGTFLSDNRCEATANRQIDRRSAVVFDAAGACGLRALQAVVVRGAWGVGVDNDMSYLGPQILGSVVKQVERATQFAVTLFAYGQLPGGKDLRLDLASDGIGLVVSSDRVPSTVRAKVEKVAAKLRARDQARDAR